MCSPTTGASADSPVRAAMPDRSGAHGKPVPAGMWKDVLKSAIDPHRPPPPPPTPLAAPRPLKRALGAAARGSRPARSTDRSPWIHAKRRPISHTRGLLRIGGLRGVAHAPAPRRTRAPPGPVAGVFRKHCCWSPHPCNHAKSPQASCTWGSLVSPAQGIETSADDDVCFFACFVLLRHVEGGQPYDTNAQNTA